MKIGIIGLRPHQIADIQNRKFPFDFEFYTDKTVTRAKILAFAQRQAKVLIVVRGTTNDVPGWVDSEKKVIVHGAASAVVRALNGIVNLQQLAQATPSTSPASTESRSYTAVGVRQPVQPPLGALIRDQLKPSFIVAQPLMKPIDESKSVDKGGRPKELHFDPVDGFATSYIHPQNAGTVATTYPKGDGQQSYTLLSAAIKGDILRFIRPAGLEFNTWRNRITVARNFYLRRHNVLAEAHFYVGYVDLFVLAAGSTPQSTVEDPAAREGAVPRQRDENASVNNTEYFPSDGPGVAPVIVTVLEDAVVPQDTPMLATREEAYQQAETYMDDVLKTPQEDGGGCTAITPKLTDRSVRQFWQQSFLIALGQQQRPSEAAVTADQSVQELTQRYT